MKKQFLLIGVAALVAATASAQQLYDDAGNPTGPFRGPDAPGDILRSIPGQSGTHADVGFDGTDVLVVDYRDSFAGIYVLDNNTGALITTVPIDSTSDFGLAYDASRSLYVTCNASTDVVKTFTAGGGGVPTNTWSFGASTGPVGVAHDTLRDVYWVCDWTTNQVIAVDPNTGVKGTAYSTAAVGCTRPAGVAYIASTDEIVVGGRDQNRMYIMDAATGLLNTSYAAADGGNNPQGVAHNSLENIWQSSWNGPNLFEIEHNNSGGCGPFTLFQPSPGMGGVNNTMSVRCATPLGNVLFAGNKKPGSTPIGTCGLNWDIKNAKVFGPSAANGAGSATSPPVFVPPKATGFTTPIQALDISSCTKSALVMVTWT